MPEHVGGKECDCWGCINVRSDSQARCVRPAREYPVEVGGIVSMRPYPLALKATKYSSTCVSESHLRDRVPASARDSWLCQVCEARITDGLRWIEDSWPMLDEFLHRRKGAVQERRADNQSSPAPLDISVVTVMDEVAGWLKLQAFHWHEDHPGQVYLASSNPRSIARWLGRWKWNYFGSHPQSSFAAMVPDEVDARVREIQRILNESGSRRVNVDAKCARFTVDDHGSTVACPGELYALVTDRMSIAPSEIRCSCDPDHAIPQHEWLKMFPQGANRAVK